MRCGYTTSPQSQTNPAWNGVRRDLHHPESSRHSCQLERSWKVFWDSEGMIHVNFLLHSVTVTAQYYSNLFHSNVYQAIPKKRLRKLSMRIILLHDNARRNMADLMKAILTSVGWEIMNHCPYCPHLAASDFHLF
jgi:hypothetical protein